MIGSDGIDPTRRIEVMGIVNLTPDSFFEGSRTSSVAAAVRNYFSEFASRADETGIDEWILDPGFGFAKSIEQNYELLAHLDEVLIPRHRTLVGLSRKSMIYKPLGITPEDSLPQTQVLNLAALERGADILRVHDVAECLRTVATYRRLSL